MLLNLDAIGTVNIIRTGPQCGTPLVLLHPVSMDVSWWGDQFRAFGADRDMIAIDLPGHGLSAQPNAPLTFDGMADAVEGVLASLGVGPVDLLGVSVGGMIAQTVALRRPGLVRSLVLVATLCTFPENVRALLRERAGVARTDGMARIAELSIERWFTPAFQARRPDMIARATIGLLRQPGDYHARMWDMIAGLDLEDRLPAVACPTLVVTGAGDVNAPPAAAQQIARAITGAQVVLMPDLGHFPPFEDPDGFNAILRDFLVSVDERDAAALSCRP